MALIEMVDIRLLDVPLSRPYKLSFGTVLAFNTLLVEVRLADGRSGQGDGTILTGYTDETMDQCWTAARDIAPRLLGLDADRVPAALSDWLVANPFTVSAFCTACDMARGHPTLAPGDCRVPVLGIVNTTDPARVEPEVEGLLQAGYRTIKVKVGWDVDDDLARVRQVQRLLRGKAMIRVDANQGYKTEDGCRFAGGLEPDGIELFEQACRAGDWNAAVAVKRVATVPIMLDESIYTMDDVEIAARLQVADIIKLKLMKLGSVDALERALARIRALGIAPVLGNGVATEVGCWMEACVAAKMLDTAGEMVGFLKQHRGLLEQPMPVQEGAIVLSAGFIPRLDAAAVDAVTIGHLRYRTSQVAVPAV